MEEKEISEQDSLLLIRQMIHTAKREQKDDGKGWIVWGWLLLLASVLTVLRIRYKWNVDLFFFWNVFGGISVAYFIGNIISYFLPRKNIRVRTYTGDLFAKLNAGFFISLMFIIVSINVGSRAIYESTGSFHISTINTGFALLINLYAFWILIYGTALNFRPSVIGAYCTWAIGFAAMFMQSFQNVMLLHALAVLVGYIIPGHIANMEFKKLKRKGNVGV